MSTTKRVDYHFGYRAVQLAKTPATTDDELAMLRRLEEWRGSRDDYMRGCQLLDEAGHPELAADLRGLADE